MLGRILFQSSCRLLRRTMVLRSGFSSGNITSDEKVTHKMTFDSRIQDEKWETIPSQEVLLDERLPDGKPKKMGRILQEMLDLLNNRNTTETLDFVSKYASIMNTHHVYRSFANIMRELKSSNFDPQVIQMLRSDENFQKLCVLAGKKATYFDAKHCGFMIRYLIHLGFNSDSILLRIFMELCKHHVNDLNMTHIAVLGHYLCKLDSTQQTNFLKQVFAVAVNNNLKLEFKMMESDRFIYLLEAYGQLLNPETLDFLIEQLLLRTNSRNFNKPESVIKSLAVMCRQENDLIQACIDICKDFLDQHRFDIDEVVELVEALSQFQWYSPDLFNKIVHFVDESTNVIDDWQLASKVCHCLMSCHYYPRGLAEKLFRQLTTINVSEIDENDREILLEIIRNSQFVSDPNLDRFLSELNVENNLDIDDVLDEQFESDLNVVGHILDQCDVSKTRVDNIHGQIINVHYPEGSNISVLVLKDEDYFKNVAKLKGAKFGLVKKLRSEGGGVMVLSLWRLRKLPEKDRIGIMKAKLRDAHDNGIAELL